MSEETHDLDLGLGLETPYEFDDAELTPCSKRCCSSSTPVPVARQPYGGSSTTDRVSAALERMAGELADRAAASICGAGGRWSAHAPGVRSRWMPERLLLDGIAVEVDEGRVGELAVVAYRQPVTHAGVMRCRGESTR